MAEIKEVNCKGCDAKCCKSMFIQLDDADKNIDFLRWTDYHEGVHVLKIAGKIGIKIDSKCSMLKDGKCIAYDNRPYMCKEFDCNNPEWENYPY